MNKGRREREGLKEEGRRGRITPSHPPPPPLQAQLSTHAFSLVILLPVFDGSGIGESEEGAGHYRVNGTTHNGSDQRLREYVGCVWWVESRWVTMVIFIPYEPN